MDNKILNSIIKLEKYIKQENFSGYDPYDVLNSFIPFHWFGSSVQKIALQLHKRNPVNIRPLIGIRKGLNPKGLGLLLKAYVILFKATGIEEYLHNADWIFKWLLNNYSKGYSGICWGYNFDWTSDPDFIPAFTPSVVVTSFITDGLFEYYQLSQNKEAKDAIISSSNYVIRDLKRTELNEGVCFSYTHLSPDCCYNASLLAAEILARADNLEKETGFQDLINRSIDFIITKQKPDGAWYYSYDPLRLKERKQIDFHQGYIINSLYNLKKLLNSSRNDIDKAIIKGIDHYKNYQFNLNGRSYWRIPKKWPIDNHNQSVGIYTFANLKEYQQSSELMDFSDLIAQWTIHNMQSKKHGFFYYRKHKLFNNKISYMRWSQAWMLLALSKLYEQSL